MTGASFHFARTIAETKWRLERSLGRIFIVGLVTAGLAAGGMWGTHPASAQEKPDPTAAQTRPSLNASPNILLILADDLGYGDVQCLNPQGQIATPHLDRLAREGVIFTDAHSSSSVCTPTRYALLTGRYNWRSRLASGVQGGLSPPLIEPSRLTLASLLKSRGYHCACFGKWHLGLGWERKPGIAPFRDVIESGDEGWNVDFGQPFRDGPTALGFDEFFGIAASLDMIPYTFLEQDRVVELPTVDKSFEMMLGKPKQQTRKGPGAERFDAQDVLGMLTRRTVEFLERRAPAAREGRPFFIYLPLASPHTPIVPTHSWRGKSGLNPYADFVMETDDAVGQILTALDRLELAQDTLVIFTSDNGCSPQADYPTLLARGHNPSHVFRGHKADIFEGGHRVPLLVRWPARVAPERKSDRVVGLFDWMATFADLVGHSLKEGEGEDSVSLLSTLLGTEAEVPRPPLVHHSINGSFAIRDGDWKLILCGDSGGWSEPRPGRQGVEGSRPRQLYHLREDVGEQRNVAQQHPEKVRRLTEQLNEFITRGRSTPGPIQPNSRPIPTF